MGAIYAFTNYNGRLTSEQIKLHNSCLSNGDATLSTIIFTGINSKISKKDVRE
jgi:hypothetical protein